MTFETLALVSATLFSLTTALLILEFINHKRTKVSLEIAREVLDDRSGDYIKQLNEIQRLEKENRQLLSIKNALIRELVERNNMYTDLKGYRNKDSKDISSIVEELGLDTDEIIRKSNQIDDSEA